MTLHFRTILSIAMAIGVGIFAVVPNVAALESTAVGHASQAALETEINNYAALLARLGSDIQDSTTLSPSHVRKLDLLSDPADGDVNDLVAKIQTDTTQGELNSDATAIGGLRPIFAVLTAQVFETIEADKIQSGYNMAFDDEHAIQPALAALVGTPGYANALSQYNSLVSSVRATQLALNHVANTVLAQTPSGYPANAAVFARTAASLESAEVDLGSAAHAEEVIGLAFGGYTGH
jgi:hypothetical protein